jgi:phage-related protein
MQKLIQINIKFLKINQSEYKSLQPGKNRIDCAGVAHISKSKWDHL